MHARVREAKIARQNKIWQEKIEKICARSRRVSHSRSWRVRHALRCALLPAATTPAGVSRSHQSASDPSSALPHLLLLCRCAGHHGTRRCAHSSACRYLTSAPSIVSNALPLQPAPVPRVSVLYAYRTTGARVSDRAPPAPSACTSPSRLSPLRLPTTERSTVVKK